MSDDVRMSDAPKYTRAPLVEGVIDIHTAGSLSSRDRLRAQEKLKSRYQKVEEEQEFQIKVDNGRVETRPMLNGFKLTSSNGRDIVTIRERSLTTSCLAPYAGWCNLLEMARQNFDVVQKIAGRGAISRVGVRFVNRVDIPFNDLAGRDISDYLNIGVAMPDGIAKSVNTYSASIDFTEISMGARVILNTGVIPSTIIEHLSILLDIDVIVENDIPLNMDDFWVMASSLRDLKNNIFEMLITDRTRELIA